VEFTVERTHARLLVQLLELKSPVVEGRVGLVRGQVHFAVEKSESSARLHVCKAKSRCCAQSKLCDCTQFLSVLHSVSK